MAEPATPLAESSPPFATGRANVVAIWVLVRVAAGIAAPIWLIGFLWAGLHRDVSELLALVLGLPSLVVFAFAPRSMWRNSSWCMAAMLVAIAASSSQFLALAKYGAAYGFSDLPPVVFKAVVLIALIALFIEALSWRRASHA